MTCMTLETIVRTDPASLLSDPGGYIVLNDVREYVDNAADQLWFVVLYTLGGNAGGYWKHGDNSTPRDDVVSKHEVPHWRQNLAHCHFRAQWDASLYTWRVY